MKLILLIGAGSFIGGVSRYLLSQFFQSKTTGTFPIGTLGVNLIGCLLIGVIFGLAEKENLSPEMRMFFATGLLGGFTTFSAFSNETVAMLNEGQYQYAMTYVLSSVIFGLSATFLGVLVTRVI